MSVGDGWLGLIDNGCALIQGHITSGRSRRARALRAIRNKKLFGWELDAVKQPLCSQVVAMQVKEKFGGLRFYVSGGDAYTNGIIAMMEFMSEKTCDSCGNPGTVGGKGWLTCKCSSCRKATEK